jgi:peroxiredoxin
VCIECGSVRDVHDARLDAVKRRAAALAGRHGFAASSHVVDILGRCAACQATTHPVMGDTNHSISRAFGVLKEDAGIAYRASVIVDDKGVIRAYHVNDTAVGRSPKEVLRTAQALQSGGLCGADWKKGEKFVG